MRLVHEVPIRPVSPDRLATLRPRGAGWLETPMAEVAHQAHDRVVWHVNTTAQGGGVAEMLWPLVSYSCGAGLDCRWCVITGDAEFFRITKRIHNRLHGSAGDGHAIDSVARSHYERVLAANAAELCEFVRPGDVVWLHDPQTAGLVPWLERHGAKVVWRSHIGVDAPTQLVRDTWDTLRPYVAGADACVFSRHEHLWDGLQDDATWIIPPSIDPFSAKNSPIDPPTVAAVLRAGGLTSWDGTAEPVFTDRNGVRRRVKRHADMFGAHHLDPERPLVCQVSRWDRLKDPVGLMSGFVDGVLPHHDAQLALVGPATEQVADDPEGAEVLRSVQAAWRRLPAAARERVIVACLPMQDADENAAIVNALQRRSDIIVQKSLAEGFGLTVSEAMWKGRSVVASRVGGIQDQIEHDRSGLLLDDPRDLHALGATLSSLLSDRERSRRLGDAAQTRVLERFTATRHLAQGAELIGHLLGVSVPAPALVATR